MFDIEQSTESADIDKHSDAAGKEIIGKMFRKEDLEPGLLAEFLRGMGLDISRGEYNLEQYCELYCKLRKLRKLPTFSMDEFVEETKDVPMICLMSPVLVEKHNHNILLRFKFMLLGQTTYNVERKFFRAQIDSVLYRFHTAYERMLG